MVQLYFLISHIDRPLDLVVEKIYHMDLILINLQYRHR